MWGAALFGLGATAAGGYLCHLSWRFLRQRVAMRRWPRTQAEILGYRSETSRSSRRVDVRVRYIRDGRVVETWSRSPTGSAYGRGDVQAERQVSAEFPRGSSARVYIDPTSPDVAYLERPEPHIVAWLFCGGLLLIALAAAVTAPSLLGIEQELATLIFMLVLAVLLTVMGGFGAVALWMARVRASRRPHDSTRGTHGTA